MSSSKNHQLHPAPEPDSRPAAKRGRPEPATGSINPVGPLRVVLNPADCDLDFNVDSNGLQGQGLYEQGFAYCWSGARANVGITGGKYCFGCRIVTEQMVDIPDTPADQQHVCRVGISRGDDPVGSLGESSHSYGFGGTGKFSNARKFSDYGEKFGVGDTIICAIDLENKQKATIGFAKDGKWLGIASQFDATSWGLGAVDTRLKKLPWECALFPHILLKNVVVQLQFSVEDGLVPVEGYKPWNYAIGEGNVIIGPSFSSPKECEVLMMVGLPASGKTTWAENWAKQHPEKRYVILGTNLALDQMKVTGLLRKHNYGERFERLMDRATGIFNTLLARAARTPRNYILDQTNVYKSARNRKLKSFLDYRKIAVVVFPAPNELKIRADKRFKEMGKEVPQDAVNEMLANYVLPKTKDMPHPSEVFDEVIFTELDRVEAQKHLDEMKRGLESLSTLNTKTNFSPCSRGSSVQSFSSPAAVHKEASSAGRGRESYSHPAALFPHHDNMNPLQGNAAYGSPGLFVQHQGGLPRSDLPVSSSSPYGHYSNDPYQNSGEVGPYSRSSSDLSTYRPPGVSENTRRLSFESPISSGRGGYGYQLDPPSYSSPHDPRARQVTQDGFGRPSFDSPSSVGRPGYGHLSDPSSVGRPGYGHLSDPSSVGRAGYGHLSDPPSYNSPSACLQMPGVQQAEFPASRTLVYEWHSPQQTAYGTPYPSSAARPPSQPLPPMNQPHGRWYG